MKLHKCDFEYLYIYNASDEDKLKHESKVRNRLEFLRTLGVHTDELRPDWPKEVLLTGEQMVSCMEEGYKLEVTESRDYGHNPADDLVGILNKFEAVTEKLRAIPVPELAYNEKCHVHMPGQALSTYNAVMLLSDACSDELQAKLDKGWRIIAACPQPDQRRPDYILGRFDPTHEVGREAARY